MGLLLEVALLLSFFFLTLAAELFASAIVWWAAPTDTIRVMYLGYWDFESRRAIYWLVLTPLFMGALFLSQRIPLLDRRERASSGPDPRRRGILALLSGVVLELATSAFFWRDAASTNVRLMFSSAWFWGDSALPSDMVAWSFWGYAGVHFGYWTVAMASACLAWLVGRRRNFHR
jgi:hypothetical protein